MHPLHSFSTKAPEQLVDFKAEVCAVSATKQQEVVLRDETASVKLVLWEGYVNSLDVKVTYNIENLRIRRVQSTPVNAVSECTC